MRIRFGKWLVEGVEKNNKILLLSGDIGFGIFDDFREKFPKNFLNCGIAEQNMIGTAAGLASNGFFPIVYTIIPFLIYRPFEFIRDLIGHQNLPVVLVGVGGGFSYDKLGYTHYAVEDISIVKTIPNFEILTPFDPVSAEKCFVEAIKNKKPTYVRLMKGKEPILNGDYDNGMCCLADYGSDFQIYTHGSIASECIHAAKLLSKNYSLKGKVYAIWKYSEAVKKIIYNDNKSFFIEEHISPGLFSGIKNVNDNGLFVQKDYRTAVAEREEILSNHGLSYTGIVNRIINHF